MTTTITAELDTTIVPVTREHANVIAALAEIGEKAMEANEYTDINIANRDEAHPLIVANAMHELAHAVRLLTEVVRKGAADITEAIDVASGNYGSGQQDEDDEGCGCCDSCPDCDCEDETDDMTIDEIK